MAILTKQRSGARYSRPKTLANDQLNLTASKYEGDKTLMIGVTHTTEGTFENGWQVTDNVRETYTIELSEDEVKRIIEFVTKSTIWRNE